jgi:acetylornithine deacetylase/succinyl-diaminopimelate desuccinylase-like protein
MKRIIPIIIISIISWISLVYGQDTNTRMDEFCKKNEREILKEYFDFLSLPNYALNKEDILKNALFIQQMLSKRGIKSQLLTSKTEGTPPAVYGEVLVPGAKQTLVFYAHYDGQPVNAEKWHPLIQPFTPVFLSKPIDRGGEIISFPAEGGTIDPSWRISGRSSSDDKAGVMAIIQAYDAIVKSGLTPSVSIKFFFEGEEEIGSVHLGEILEKNKELLTSDVWIIADGPVHQSGLPLIDFGVRGDVNMDITVFGPKRPLHSGHYGNWAPNPAHTLVRLLASMKDDDGHVLIKDYDKDAIPFTESEKLAFAKVPAIDKQMQQELGIAQPEKVGASLFDSYQYPSLNINGIRSADVGDKASNVIPTEASVTLDLRQVLGTDYLRQIQKVKDHIVSQGFYVIDRNPTDEERLNYAKIAKVTADRGGYNAQRTPMDLPIAKQIIAAVQGATKEKVLVFPTAGGSLPLFLFEKHLNAKVVNLCIANHDNNQHSENENARIQNIWDSIKQLAAIMLMK